MTQEWKTEFFKGLYEKLGKVTSDNVLDQTPNGEWCVRTLLAAENGSDDSVIIQAVPFQARTDVLLMELYVLLTPEFNPQAETEMRTAIDEINSYMPVGALGINPKDRSIYLRDCFKLLADGPVDKAVDDAYVDYEMIMEVVLATHQGLKLIWTGEKTFAQVVEMGLLKKYS